MSTTAEVPQDPAPVAAGPAQSPPYSQRLRRALPRVLEALAVNAVPLYGFLYWGWSLGTLLVLYWFENLFNTVFIGGRVWLHRRLTGKRGHWNAARTMTVTTTVNGKTTTRAAGGRTTLLADFVGTNLVFTLAHGIFVGAFVYLILKVGPLPTDLGRGLLWLLAAQVLGFALDAATLRQRSFAWIKQRVDSALGRMLIVHLSLIGGGFLLAMTERPTAFFAVFVGLKLLFDLATALPQGPALPAAPPRWGAGLGGRLVGPKKFDEVWRETVENQRRKQIEDEKPLPVG